MSRAPITKRNPYTPKSGRFSGRTFYTEREYRNALAQTKGFKSWSDQQKQSKPVRSARELQTLRPSERDARARALEALSRMRNDGVSMRAAAKESGITVNALKRHAGTALVKDSRGRFVAKASDKLARSMVFPTERGMISLNVRDSRTASRISEYWSAVHTYLRTGETFGLRKFRGKSVSVEKRKYPFITEPSLLDRLFDAGELTFDDIYDVLEAA